MSRSSLSSTQPAESRCKLCAEAQRKEPNLRILVGHANFADSIASDTAIAQRMQSRRLQQSIRASHTPKTDSSARTGPGAEESQDERREYQATSSETPPEAQAAVSFSKESPAEESDTDEDAIDDGHEDEEENYPSLSLIRYPSSGESLRRPPDLSYSDDDNNGEDGYDSIEDKYMQPMPASVAFPLYLRKQTPHLITSRGTLR